MKNSFMIKKQPTVYTVLFAGEAGGGVREAGASFGRLLTNLGFSVMATADYQSLIRGGHNFTRVAFSVAPVGSDYKQVDVLVAYNAEALTRHSGVVKKTGLIISEKDIPEAHDEKNQITLPVIESAKKLSAPPIMRTSVALGALCYYFGIKIEELNKVFVASFKDKAQLNIDLAKIGYDIAVDKNIKTIPVGVGKTSDQVFLSGNQAVAEGMVKAGLKAFVAYPMTPASSIQEHLAKKYQTAGVKVIQPENEIAAANMIVGMAYAGIKSATASSGGGFALMHEAVSLSGISETPMVVVESQRPGPSTGVPTYTAQADLDFVRHSGHGEFVRVVLAPGDIAEAYEHGALAMNLAWKYQIPVLVLLDKHLSESFGAVVLPPVKEMTIKAGLAGASYQRFKFTGDGISPMVFPGAANTVIKNTSYEHDESGIATEDTKMIVAMQDKRLKKSKVLAKEKFVRLKVLGDKKSKKVVIFWGSTKGAVLEANKILAKPARLVQILSIDPFPIKEFLAAIKGANKIIAVEGNATGQLANLIREKTGLEIKNKILRYDGRPFEPVELAKELSK